MLQGTPVQERICNPYLEQDRKFCLNADDFSNIQIQMPVVREYQSNVTILEFSKNDTGMFTCKSSVPGSQKDLQISVKIDIHSVLSKIYDLLRRTAYHELPFFKAPMKLPASSKLLLTASNRCLEVQPQDSFCL